MAVRAAPTLLGLVVSLLFHPPMPCPPSVQLDRSRFPPLRMTCTWHLKNLSDQYRPPPACPPLPRTTAPTSGSPSLTPASISPACVTRATTPPLPVSRERFAPTADSRLLPQRLRPALLHPPLPPLRHLLGGLPVLSSHIPHRRCRAVQPLPRLSSIGQSRAPYPYKLGYRV